MGYEHTMSIASRRLQRSSVAKKITVTAVNQDSGQVLVSWASAISPPSGWTVGRNGTDLDGYGPWSTTVTGSTRSLTFTRLVTGTTYTFTISGGNKAGNAQCTVASDPLSNFAASAASDTAINLTWSYSGGTVSNFALTRGGTGIATVSASARSYSDTGLSPGTTYSYGLVANYAAGGASNSVSASARTSGGATGSWLSGGSGDEVTDGTFGTWRGTPVVIGTTWSTVTTNDSECEAAMVACWQFDLASQYQNWPGDVDWSPGALLPSQQYQWYRAATGEYDDLWSRSLNAIKTKWYACSRGTCYIRFAHEMSGNWYPWGVPADQVENFKIGWRRYRGLQQQIFPAAKLVFGTNTDTSFGYDWRTLWPGDQYVDVYGTDWYASFYKLSIINGQQYAGDGGPLSLEGHRQFAQDHGVPFCIPEWGVMNGPAGTGDDPSYIQYVHDFCVSNGGTGAGNVLYECYFNIDNGDGNRFLLLRGGSTADNPNAAARYRSLF